MDKMTPGVMLRVNLRQPEDPCTWGIKQVVPIMKQYAAQQVAEVTKQRDDLNERLKAYESGGHTLVATSKLSEMTKDREMSLQISSVLREQRNEALDNLEEVTRQKDQAILDRDALKVEVEELRRLSPDDQEEKVPGRHRVSISWNGLRRQAVDAFAGLCITLNNCTEDDYIRLPVDAVKYDMELLRENLVWMCASWVPDTEHFDNMADHIPGIPHFNSQTTEDEQ